VFLFLLYSATSLQQLEDNDLQQFNALLTRLGVPNVFVAPKKPIG
jgi:hypothetical protein